MSSSWVDIDWSDNHVPTEDEIEQSLRNLQFRPVSIEADAVIRLVDTFNAMLTNGGAYAAAFDVADSDDIAAWLISRNRDEYTLADTLVRSLAFAEAMPEVAGTGPLDPTDFERSSALTLDGDLARKLQWGGAYTNPSMPGAQAKALGAAFCADLFGDRYDDVDVDYSWARWSAWFRGIAWDATWVVTDRRHRHLTVLCLTDTD